MKNLKLEDLTIAQKLGMVFCARPMEEADIDYTVEMIRKHALGCVQIRPEKHEFMEKVLEAADYPLLILCDTERGYPSSNLPKISLMALSACNNPKYLRTFAKGVVTEAKKAGYNGTWGPVLDVLSGDYPGYVGRVFSDDPLRVGRCAEEIARVYQQYGYLSCGKHYPGGAEALPYDSHMAPTHSEDTADELLNKSLVPYRYLMEKDLLPSIMTSHKKFVRIDSDNAGTLSPKVHKIIRDLGFDGICFSDSLAMMAVLQQYGEEKVLGLAIAAGNDIVLPNYRTGVQANFERLVKNFEDGLFSEERLDEAVRRVLKAQKFVGKAPEVSDPFTAEDRAVFDAMARDCITAVCDDGVNAVLSAEKRHLFVIVTDRSFDPEKASLEVATDQWYHPDRIAKKIKTVFPNAGVEFLPEFPLAGDNKRVLIASTEYDDVVFVTFCVTGAYLGTDCLTRRVENVIDCVNISHKLAAVVHFGNPFALKHLLHVPRKIFGYDIPDAQLYAIDVLAGKLPAVGKLPFRIDFQ